MVAPIYLISEAGGYESQLFLFALFALKRKDLKSMSIVSLILLIPIFFCYSSSHFFDTIYTFAKTSADLFTVMQTKFKSLSQSIRTGRLPADIEFVSPIDAAVRRGLEEELSSDIKRADEIEGVYADTPTLEDCMKKLWPGMIAVNTIYSGHFEMYHCLSTFTPRSVFIYDTLYYIFISLFDLN